MQMFRRLLIYCLIAVILPWGALAQAASPQAVFTATPTAGDITVKSDAVAAKDKRCRIAILTGSPCFAAIVHCEAPTLNGIPHICDRPFAVVVALPEGVTTGGYLDPPRRG